MASALEENSDNKFVKIMDFPDVETDGSDVLDVGIHVSVTLHSVNWYNSMFSEMLAHEYNIFLNMDDKFSDMPPSTDDKFPDEDSDDDMPPPLESFSDAGSDGESSDSEHPITFQNSSAYFESLHYRLKVEEEKEKGKKRMEREMKEKGKKMNN